MPGKWLNVDAANQYILYLNIFVAPVVHATTNTTAKIGFVVFFLLQKKTEMKTFCIVYCARIFRICPLRLLK